LNGTVVWSSRGVLNQVDLAAFAGQRARYVLTYQRKRIPRGCPHDTHLLPAGTGSIRLPMLTAVQFPDLPGTANDVRSYEIATNDPFGGSGSGCNLTSGTVRQLTLPTGGKIEYGYSAWAFPTRCDYSSEAPSLIQTTYTAAGIGSASWSVLPARSKATGSTARRCVPWPRSTTARRAGGRTTG
jgi:hypothetical protein